MGESESGDSYGPFVFSTKPTEDLLKRIAHYCDGGEEEDGPGDFGSYVFLGVTSCLVDLALIKKEDE
jgi:hypothetical protein